jgi:hypothetical protein
MSNKRQSAPQDYPQAALLAQPSIASVSIDAQHEV